MLKRGARRARSSSWSQISTFKNPRDLQGHPAERAIPAVAHRAKHSSGDRPGDGGTRFDTQRFRVNPESSLATNAFTATHPVVSNRQTAYGEIDDVRHLPTAGAIRRLNSKSCEQRRDIASKITWIEGSFQVALLLSTPESFFEQRFSTLAPVDECLFDRFSASAIG